MFGLSMTELLVVLVVVMLVFGANRLPELGSSLGKAISGFKKAVGEQDRNITPPAERARLDAQEVKEEETILFFHFSQCKDMILYLERLVK